MTDARMPAGPATLVGLWDFQGSAKPGAETSSVCSFSGTGSPSAGDLPQGTLVLAFRAGDVAPGAPAVLVCSGPAAPEAVRFEISATAEGAITVVHAVPGAPTATLATAAGMVAPGTEATLVYSWNAGSGAFLSVDNETTGASSSAALSQPGLSLPVEGGADALFAFGTEPAGSSVLAASAPGGMRHMALYDVDVAEGDFVVEGSDGPDLIDAAYAGDPDGDRIDAGDGPGGTDRDLVDAGAGDDTVRAGADADTVFAGPGDDLVAGEGGDDVLRGDAALAGTVRESFEWDLAPAPDGTGTVGDEETIGDFTQDTGSVEVAFSVTAPSDKVLNRFEDTEQAVSGIDAGGGVPDAWSSFNSDGLGDGATESYALDFSAPVSNVAFRINDIDLASVATVRAFGPAGEPLPVDLELGGRLEGRDTDGVPGIDTGASTGGAQPDSSLDYSMLVEIPGPVSRIEIIHLQDGGGLSGINVTDIWFDAPAVLSSGDDTLDGGEGDDLLLGEGGADWLFGGTGHDTLIGGDGTDRIWGGTGEDRIAGGTPGVTGTAAIGGSNDSLFGDEGDDIIDGSSGDDLIDGGDGDDTLAGGSGGDTIQGGDGDDLILLGGEVDILTGETRLPSEDADLAAANAIEDGDNLAFGGRGADTIIGSPNNDSIDGGEGADLILGLGGQDTLFGNQGADTVDGGEGDDILDGGVGADRLFGGGGQDTITGGVGGDRIEGGDGDDLIDGGSGGDRIEGGSGQDTLSGGTGGDTLDGGAGVDRVFGGDDRDLIFGGFGDTVDGGTGGDDFDTLELRGLVPEGGRVELTDVTIDPDGDSTSGVAVIRDGSGDEVGRVTYFEIENVIPCFTPGARIATPRGEVAVETLREGDRVLTRDNGIQEIRWIGSRTLSRDELQAAPHLRPVLIRKGALGDGLPERDMLVSPQHRVLVAGRAPQLYFAESEVLVAAKHLVGRPGIEAMETLRVSYVHLLFDRHEVVLSDGSWTESFQPGDLTLGAMGEAQRDEIVELFPELADRVGRRGYAAARRALKGHEARLLQF